jgi:ferrous iron transport protein A
MIEGTHVQDRTKLSALSELGIGKMAIVEALDLPEEVGHHLMHMGIVPDARVIVIRRAPAGDPTVYYIEGFELALRRETARSIRVRPVEDDH